MPREQLFSFSRDMMANTSIALSHIIISLWTVIQVHIPYVTSSLDNYIMAYENKTWADEQIKKAQNKCEEYTQYACQYHTSDEKKFDKDRLLNGEYVSEGIFPHMAYLLIRIEPIVKRIHSSKKIWDCGGTLISEKFVMTAAHCTFGVNFQGEIKIKLGSLDITNDGSGQWYDVDRIYPHPYFKYSDGLLHDIALIELSETVHFNANMRPICLNTNYEISTHNSAIAAGWGDTEHGGTNYLKMAELPINESACDILFIRCGQFYDVAKSYTICAGETKKGPCHGDSGAPLQILRKNACPNISYEQIGIASFGYGACSSNSSFNLGLYRKVALYVPWIASIVWNETDG